MTAKTSTLFSHFSSWQVLLRPLTVFCTLRWLKNLKKCIGFIILISFASLLITSCLVFSEVLLLNATQTNKYSKKKCKKNFLCKLIFSEREREIWNFLIVEEVFKFYHRFCLSKWEKFMKKKIYLQKFWERKILFNCFVDSVKIIYGCVCKNLLLL